MKTRRRTRSELLGLRRDGRLGRLDHDAQKLGEGWQQMPLPALAHRWHIALRDHGTVCAVGEEWAIGQTGQ